MTQSTDNSDNKNGEDLKDDGDLSDIEIFDTSKGDKIDFTTTPYNQIYTLKCPSCGYRYEGIVLHETCPKCGSDKILDY